MGAYPAGRLAESPLRRGDDSTGRIRPSLCQTTPSRPQLQAPNAFSGVGGVALDLPLDRRLVCPESLYQPDHPRTRYVVIVSLGDPTNRWAFTSTEGMATRRRSCRPAPHG